MSSRPSILMALLYIVLASILLIIPLPHWALVWRPQWMLLFILMWMMFYRNYTSLAVVFILGLFIDLLTGTLLGQHAFAYLVVTYLFMHFQHRIQQFHLIQQAVCVLLLSMLSFLCQWGLAMAFSVNTPSFLGMLSAGITALLWPWLMVLFNAISHQRSTVSFMQR